MKKTLFLVRHATAEDLGNSHMLKDFDRELTSFGIIEAARVAQKLVNQAIKTDLIVCSHANRAKETAKIFAEQLKYDAENIQANETLYGGGARAYLSLLNEIEKNVSSLMLVGHNPDITFFVEYLTRGDVGSSMETSGVAIVEFEDIEWTEVSAKTGVLVSYITPKNNE